MDALWVSALVLLLARLCRPQSAPTAVNIFDLLTTRSADTGKYNISLCTYFSYYEHCYIGKETDDYDLTIDVDYVWGLFESTRKSEVDKIKIMKIIRSYLQSYNLPEKLDTENIVSDRADFCLQCKEITEDALYFYDIADNLVKYFSPFLLVLGTTGNVLCLVIMLRKSMKDSVISAQIAVIAVVDTLNLWYGDFLFYLEKSHGIYLTDLSNVSCVMAETIQNSLLVLSCWLITFISIERFIAVMFPLKSKLFLTKWVVLVVSTVLAILSICINIPSLFVALIKAHKDHVHCYMKQSKIVFNQEFMMGLSVLFSYIPFFVILFANLVIITKISCTRADLGQQTANIQTTSMTISLVAVSLVFLILTFPITFFNFGETVMFTGFHPEVRGSLFYLYSMVAHCMMYLNYGINFYLYIAGPRFRRELLLMFQDLAVFLCGNKLSRSDENTSRSGSISQISSVKEQQQNTAI